MNADEDTFGSDAVAINKSMSAECDLDSEHVAISSGAADIGDGGFECADICTIHRWRCQ